MDKATGQSHEAEKAFDKIQCLLIIKTHNKLEIETKFVNWIKSINKQPITASILNIERLVT